MGRCDNCCADSENISKFLKLCLKCIRNNFDRVLPQIKKVHQYSREIFGLPHEPPKSCDGILCNMCVQRCQLSEGCLSYCGLRTVSEKKIVGVTAEEGNLSWYHDPLPTNCVADWVCAGGTGAGYPKFAYKKGAEYNYKNLAVFYHACSFNCLFCQNWHFKEMTLSKTRKTVSQLVEAVDELTSCICFFGGDPTPQINHSINASMHAIEKNKNRILRICWETNGTMHPSFLNKIMDIALESGGCIKFDLKAWDEKINIAMCGVSNKMTLENFELAGKRIKERPHPPPLIASTLLIPGYIDEEEISNISRFIASINPDIPYALLAFYPQFLMNDLPITSKEFAFRCLETARSHKLSRVRLGNIHLL